MNNHILNMIKKCILKKAFDDEKISFHHSSNLQQFLFQKYKFWNTSILRQSVLFFSIFLGYIEMIDMNHFR